MLPVSLTNSVLMWRYTNVPSTVEDAGKKGHSVSILCLEGLLRVFTTVVHRYPTRMGNFLSSLGGGYTPPETSQSSY